MAKTINNKYIVLKTDDVENYLDPSEQEALAMVCRVLNYCRNKDGKKENSYYVCNTDEPYADKVLQVILNGEDLKNK